MGLQKGARIEKDLTRDKLTYLGDKGIEGLSLSEVLDSDRSEVILEPQCWHHTTTMTKGNVTLQKETVNIQQSRAREKKDK